MPRTTTSRVIASVLALIVLFTGAVLPGRRMARSRGSVRATTAAIASAMALYVLTYPFNILIDIDNQEFAGLVVLVEFALPPLVAGVIAWSAAEHSRRRGSVVASVVPVLALAFILNPLTEFLIACAFGRSIYLTQFFGFASCG